MACGDGDASPDVVIRWGMTKPLPFQEPPLHPTIIIDFPYWNRVSDSRGEREFYKLSVNAQHPTKLIMTETHSMDRYRITGGAKIEPWKKDGRNILLCGMGRKAAKQWGYAPGEWERNTVDLLRRHTDRPIIYRPKPKQDTPPIDGTIFDDGTQSIESALTGVFAMVCPHGNPTVAALAAGIPVFMREGIGAATHCAEFDLAKIESPRYPDNREQFLANIAHWQFSCQEIKTGAALQSYINRGLLAKNLCGI